MELLSGEQMIHPLKIFVALFRPFYAFQLQQLHCWMQIVSQCIRESWPFKNWPDTPCNGKAQRNSMKRINLWKFPITQVEKALCSQTFSLKPLDMTKTEWKVLPFFPLSGTVHLVGTTLFPVSPPVLQLQP